MRGDNSYAVKVRSDQAQLWRQRQPLLSHLDIELTERCNNNCIHCYINLPIDDIAAKERELSTEKIKEILKEAAALGCLILRFTGGEPLLREDFEELYIFARRLGLKVLLFTNGTLISPNLAKLFARIPPLQRIEISVYGMTARSYEAISRISGSFEAAWRGIHLLLESKVPFVVKGALLPPNRDEIEEFESWTSTLPWMDKSPPYSMFYNLRCRRDSKEKNRLIKKLRLSPEKILEILTRKKEEYLKEMKDFCSKFIIPSGENLFSCGAGVESGCVDAYGHFQLCIMLRHPDTIYDLKQGFFKDAVMTFFPKILKMKPKNPDYLACCARCFLKGLCEQCPAMAWMEHGTLDTPVEYLCEITHAQARYLGLLEKDEMAWNVRDWKERIRKFSGKHSIEHCKSCRV